MTRVLLTILTHHDLPRLERAVTSAKRQRRARSIAVESLVVVNTLDGRYEKAVREACARWGVKALATDSNGKPGRGKNACLDAFLSSDAEYLYQLDGDDFLYPTWARSVEAHLRRIPGLDALGIVPLDCVGSSEGFSWTLPDGSTKAGVWTASDVYPWEGAGPGRSPLWDVSLSASPDMVRLVSRETALIWRFDEDLAVGEDHLMSLRLLASHIRGDLRYWMTMGFGPDSRRSYDPAERAGPISPGGRGGEAARSRKASG